MSDEDGRDEPSMKGGTGCAREARPRHVTSSRKVGSLTVVRTVRVQVHVYTCRQKSMFEIFQFLRNSQKTI